MTFDNCTHLYNHYHNQGIDYFHPLFSLPSNLLPIKMILLPLVVNPLPDFSQTIRYLISLTALLPFYNFIKME